MKAGMLAQRRTAETVGTRRSLRTAVVAMVVALEAIIAVLGLRDARSEWRRYRHAQSLFAVNAVIDDLMQGAENLAFERGRTNVLLRGSVPYDDEQKQNLSERRAAVDKMLTQAVEAFDGDPDEKVRDGLGTLHKLRGEVDTALAQPVPQRDPTLRARWVAAETQLLRDIHEMMVRTSVDRRDLPSQFLIYTRIKSFALELRSHLGLESSTLSAALGDRGPLPAQARLDIMELRGHSGMEWDELAMEVQISANARLIKALEGVKNGFFAVYRPMEDLIMTVPSLDMIDPHQMVKTSEPALGSLAALMEATSDETAHYCLDLEAEAKRSLVLHILISAGMMLLGLAVVFLISRRLLAPLRNLRHS